MTDGADEGGGWLAEVRREPSPNFDARPQGEAPSLLVGHVLECGNRSLDPLARGTADTGFAIHDTGHGHR